MTIRIISVLVGLMFYSGAPAWAAVGAVIGDEPELWAPDHDRLIVARVREIMLVEGEQRATHIMTLEPLATLAGSLDPSESVSLKVRVRVSGFDSSVDKLPQSGSFVLAVIRTADISANGGKPALFVEFRLCQFMPDDRSSPLIAIDGMNDKRILQALDRVRAVRTHSDPNLPVEKEKARAVLEKAIDDALAEERQSEPRPATQKAK